VASQRRCAAALNGPENFELLKAEALVVGSSYDAAGNQPVFASSNLVYDAENRQLTATNSGSGAVVTYAYDGLGLRVSKSSSATGITTIYVHDAFGNLAVEYNPPATSLCTTCYLSWDHLGSTRMVTDASVIPVTGPKARHDYVPFGVEIPTGYAGRVSPWGVSDGLTPKFTGQDRDTDTGLDFFQARYMGSAQGRFYGPSWRNRRGILGSRGSWKLYRCRGGVSRSDNRQHQRNESGCHSGHDGNVSRRCRSTTSHAR